LGGNCATPIRRAAQSIANGSYLYFAVERVRTRMNKVLTDGIALATSGIGIVLMILTAVWRVNPVEGSVMPDFLEGNPFGEALLFVLIVTCMPVWIPTVFSVVVLASLVGIPESDSYVLANSAAVIVQGMVFFILGKLISGWVRRLRAKRRF
jgi:hypothetical protein